MLVVAALVTGLSIAQAMRQDSFDPILVICWLPAVMIAAYYGRPASGRRCLEKFLHKPQP